MSRLNLAGLSVGDIVRVSQTVQVTDKKDADSENVGWIRGEDVRSGGFHYYGDFERTDSVQIEMVKKAAKPKPKVGDVLRGQDIRATRWKRGTVLRYVHAGLTASVYMLNPHGEWYASNGVTGIRFSDWQDSDAAEVIYLP